MLRNFRTMRTDKIPQASKEKTQVIRKQEIKRLQVSQQLHWWSHTFKILKENDLPPRILLTAKLWIQWAGKIGTFPHIMSQEATGICVPPVEGNKPPEAEMGDPTQQSGGQSPQPPNPPTPGIVTVV